ncbi:MAG: transposase [Vicinamibacterales bacterium]|nr:transposase [Vicinamibacterales bacterium]
MREPAITSGATVTIGLDLGDRMTEGCVMDATGAVVERFRTRTTRARVVPTVARYPGARVILEVGSQPPWLSRALTAAGCDVIVANARRVRLIAEHDAKSDRLDAELLARLGRVDPTLLAPIQHRGEQAQRDLSLLRTRASLEVGQSFRAAGASPQGDARFRASASSRTSGR